MTNANEKKSTDLWFEQQIEAIRQIKPDHTPDVTDAVMRRIASMPQPMALPQTAKRRPLRIVSSLAAACFAGAAIVTLVISRFDGSARAANISTDMGTRVFEIYQYCNDYACEENIESPAYYDNPLADFI